MRRRHESHFRLLLRVLPKWASQRIVRGLIKFDFNLQPDIEFKIAETPDEVEQALQLVHNEYVRLGYIQPRADGKWSIEHHLLTSTVIVIAKLQNQVLGTLTIARDDIHPLPVEKVFDLKDFKSKNRRRAEITCLTVHPDYRRRSKGSLVIYLMKYMYLFCTHHFGVSDLFITVLPKDALFYESLLLFDRPNQKDQIYMGAPAALLHLDLSTASQRFKSIYSSKWVSQDLYSFFVLKKEPQFSVPNRVWEEIEYCPAILQSKIEKDENFGSIIKEKSARVELTKLANRQRSKPRIAVATAAILKNRRSHLELKVTIHDCSESGLLIQVQSETDLIAEVDQWSIQWKTPSGTIDSIDVEFRWHNKAEQLIGLKVIKPSFAWRTTAKLLLEKLHKQSEQIDDQIDQTELAAPKTRFSA